jgi:hypothetical protein
MERSRMAYCSTRQPANAGGGFLLDFIHSRRSLRTFSNDPVAERGLSSSSWFDGTNRLYQELLDQDLVDVPTIDPGVPPSGPDHQKALTKICLQRREVVSADEREDLLVPLLLRCVECRLEETSGNALAPELEVDVRAEGADVIKSCRISGERLHDLKPDQSLVGPPNGYFPDAAPWKVEKIVALGLDAERRVERGVHARLDDRIENANQRFRIGWLSVSNRELHA